MSAIKPPHILHLLLASLVLVVCLAPACARAEDAYDVLVLQTRPDPGYDEVLKGFRIDHNFSQRVIVLTDYAEVNVIRIVREVTNPHETPARLDSLAGKIDALWMLPDSTAVTHESSEAYLQFSQAQPLPLVSFTGAYLDRGAAITIDIDRQAMGSQAAIMAAKLLANNRGVVTLESPLKTRVRANRGALQRLKIDIHQLEKFAVTSSN